MKRLASMVLGIVFGGCSGYGEIPADLCKKQHIEEGADGEIAVCEELYDEAPYIHLPKDEADRAFAGVVGTGFVSASGKKYSGVDHGAEMDRHGVLVYELSLDGKRVEDYRPVLEIRASAFLAPFYGRAAEGAIARSTGADTWAQEPSLPVRFEFDGERPDDSLSGNPEARLTIANLHEDVTASDGSCLPALSSHGEDATFGASATVELRAYRRPSMHDFGDDQFVFLFMVDGKDEGTLMAPNWYRGPIDLARGSLLPPDGYEGTGHGTPGAIPEFSVELVEGGGEPCAP